MANIIPYLKENIVGILISLAFSAVVFFIFVAYLQLIGIPLTMEHLETLRESRAN